MNKIRVVKSNDWYNIFIDGAPQYFSDSMQDIISWLELNFAPPIKVSWCVDARSEQEIKTKYNY